MMLRKEAMSSPSRDSGFSGGTVHGKDLRVGADFQKFEQFWFMRAVRGVALLSSLKQRVIGSTADVSELVSSFRIDLAILEPMAWWTRRASPPLFSPPLSFTIVKSPQRTRIIYNIFSPSKTSRGDFQTANRSPAHNTLRNVNLADFKEV